MSTTAIDIVKILQPEEMLETSSDTINITDFEDVASYNWLDEPKPTLLVPGIPPIWSPPAVAPHLEPDGDNGYVDQSKSRNPSSPLDYLVLAVLHMQPHFDLALVDVITDRRPIHQLLAFANGKATDFEFGAEVIGTTVLFARTKDQPHEILGGFSGYRRAYNKQYTKFPDCAKGSISHHRIVGYSFGGLRFLVRSVADAYLEDLISNPENSGWGPAFDEDDISKRLKSASLPVEVPTTHKTSAVPVTVVEGGRKIPHAALLELKTRSRFSMYPFKLDDRLGNLWVSQTPNFVLASYRTNRSKWSSICSGLPRLAKFVEPDVKPMHEVFEEWEARNEGMLHRLSHVLKKVIEAVNSIHASCVVRYDEEAGLRVLKVKDGSIPALPEDLRKNWYKSADLAKVQKRECS